MAFSPVCRRGIGAVLLCLLFPQLLISQPTVEPSQTSPEAGTSTPALMLDPSRRADLEKALAGRDYKTAETILVEEADRNPHSLRAANLLEFAGGVFFLDGAYIDSVLAWQRADAIAPLAEASRFTLAMALVKLRNPQGARLQLEKLANAQPGNPLYFYWLARLDYDSQKYADAISRLQRVTQIQPNMTRAYNLLGLCHDYQGQLNEAIAAFTRAVELNRTDPKPSPWPNLDMANSQIELNQLVGAEHNLQEAITYDPYLAQARYNLGRVFEKEGKYEEAVRALNAAAAIDPSYPEPHYLLGRIYQRLGRAELAKNEIQRFQELQKTAAPVTSSK